MKNNKSNFYLQRLPYHLSKAGRNKELKDLLFRFDWIERQVRSSNIVGAIADYDLLPEDSEVQTLGRSLLLSREALASYPDQLSFQLQGRLAESPKACIRTLLSKAQHANTERLWIRPVIASLQSPEAPLQWTIRASSSRIDAIVKLEGGSFACATGGKVKIWDAGPELREIILKIDGGAITHLSFITEDQLLSGADDGSIHLWNINNAKIIRTFSGHSSAISALAVYDDTFVSTASDGLILSWNLAKINPRNIFKGHGKKVNDITFLSKKLLASVADDRTLRLWNLATGKQTHSATFPKFQGQRITKWRRRELLTGTFAGEVYAWRVKKRSLKIFRSFFYSAVGLNSFILLRSNLGVSDTGGKPGLRPWDPETGRTGTEIYVPGGDIVSCIKVNETSVLCGTKDGYISRVQIPSMSLATEHGKAPAPVYSLAAVDDKYVVSTAEAGKIQVWDSHSGAKKHSLQGDGKLASGVSILREDRIASVGMGSSRINIWNPLPGDHIFSIETEKEIGLIHAFTCSILAVAPSMTTKHDYSTKVDSRTIDLWDVDRRQLIGSFPELPLTISTMASIAGRFLIVGTFDNLILHLDISTCKDRRNFQLKGHSRGVVILSILDDVTLASGSLDNSIRLWDLESQECIGVIEGHEKAVTGLVPLSNRYLASASQDQTVRIWDLEARGQIHRVDCDAGLHCLTTTPDRKSLVAGDERGQVHFLRVENLGVLDKTRRSN